MLVFTFRTGTLSGTRAVFDQPLTRLGRASDCDVRFDDDLGREVSAHHAQVVRDDEGWLIIDTASTNGTWVNGERIVKHRLADGDVVVLGGEKGIEARVDVERDAPSTPAPGGRRTVVAETQAGTPLPRHPADLQPLVEQVKRRADTGVARVADVTTQKVAHERALAGGKSSGKTLAIIAHAMAEVHAATRRRVGRRWMKVVAGVGAAGLLVAAGMGVVIFLQGREIQQLVTQKQGIDREIAAVELAMAAESDPDRLSALEARLAELTGSAEHTLGELARKDVAKAQELKDAGDDLDRAIRRILEKFDAHTYAVPPVFRQALEREVNVLARAGNLKVVYARRNRYWPVITKEFSALGLPEEMAYIAWAETQFDPEPTSPAGARGMWQMTAGTARELGLAVDGKVDERLDVEKQTRAAARKLANLLAEFGADSFMLAMASYNRGEYGVRRALREVAREKGGFRREKRDFWHLYRLKKLPEETRDYVPRVLAAAVVCNDPHRYGLAP
jgi:pSer/pThr/pTyr-binding forkhead associated (FHA) protein/soluble lytic murein transglycosylase-like protein